MACAYSGDEDVQEAVRIIIARVEDRREDLNTRREEANTLREALNSDREAANSAQDEDAQALRRLLRRL